VEKPVLIYDGDCSVCRRQVQNLRVLVGDRFGLESFRSSDFSVRFPATDLAECNKAIQLLTSNKRYSGAEAVARTMALRWFFYPFLLLYYLPGLRSLWDWFYRIIARNRFWISEKWPEAKKNPH